MENMPLTYMYIHIYMYVHIYKYIYMAIGFLTFTVCVQHTVAPSAGRIFYDSTQCYTLIKLWKGCLCVSKHSHKLNIYTLFSFLFLMCVFIILPLHCFKWEMKQLHVSQWSQVLLLIDESLSVFCLKTSWKAASCCQLVPVKTVCERPSHCWCCRSNMCPENSTANNHDFQMHCFEETTSCKACSMLLRFLQLSLSLRLSLFARSPLTLDVSMLSCAGGYSSRVTAVHAAKWLRTRSVWAESPPADDTQVSLSLVCVLFTFSLKSSSGIVLTDCASLLSSHLQIMSAIRR